MQVILTMVFVKETRWMATLEELRGQLDVVDDQIVKLYEERMKICEQVGEYKVEAGRKVLTCKEKESFRMWHQKFLLILIKKEFRNCISSLCP